MMRVSQAGVQDRPHLCQAEKAGHTAGGSPPGWRGSAREGHGNSTREANVTTIHPTALVSPDARLGVQVSIGPFAIVEAGAEIGDRCQIGPRVSIKSGTSLGEDNQVFESAVLGGLPQHLRAGQHVGTLRIGRANLIRENVTIHRAFRPDGATVVGDENMIMINTHIAHDCVIGSNTILANNVMLAGHVEVDDRAYLSGAVGIHQFCRVGRLAMVGGQGHITRDVPPFVTVDGESSYVVGLNVIGLRRAGYGSDELKQIKAAYRVLYRSSDRLWAEIQRELPRQFPSGPAAELAQFVQHSGRGITPERRERPGTLKLAEFRASKPDSTGADGLTVDECQHRKAG
jgi:UDP-N-acetylglucosamine acyltransferase